MENEILVKAEGVSKKFCRDLKLSLWYGLKDMANEFIGNESKGELRKKEFWAVSDVSFELRRGECLGLVGHNGAGKSTLLKILNGLIKPDKGRVRMKGRIGALIELGSGFNPLLTGRENIYINGQILGFKKKEIDKKFDQIVAFSEIGDFIDTPVQNYSSGMKVRLGFAIASQMEPDVLIIDEVLAVGDVGFRIKCFNRIFELSKNAAIIFVSHSMPQISRIASRLVLMQKGKITFNETDIGQGIEKYFDLFEIEKAQINENNLVKIHNAKVMGTAYEESIFPTVEYGEDLTLDLLLSVDQSIEKFTINIGIRDREGKLIAQAFSNVNNTSYIENIANTLHVNMLVPKIQFSMGSYFLDLIIREYTEEKTSNYLINYRSFAHFKAANSLGFSNAPIRLPSKWSIGIEDSTTIKEK